MLLLISFAALLITFLMLTTSQSGVVLVKKSWAHYYGLRLADSAIYETISHLKEGQISFADDVRFEVEPEEVFGELSFDSETGEPYSTNNLEGNAGVTGWNGTSVPPRFCHLVAVGHYYGLTVVRQALVKDPPFPYSLASAGRIEGEEMEVFGLADGVYSALEPGETLVVEEEDKEPSHIVSNRPAGGGSGSGDVAIELRTGVSVSGNVRATSDIEVDPGAQIQGNVLPFSAEQNLPTINFDELDPAGKPGTYDWDTSFDSVVGRARHEGNLTTGDLKLSDGLLFVNGDLTVTGTITGHGALAATGKITITGSMDTQADYAALVAHDDITVRGQGPESSRFQGLVYSEGSIDISRTTIMGAAVSKSAGGTTRLEDVKAIHVPELNHIQFEIHATLKKAQDSGTEAYTGGGDPIGILQADGTFTPLDDAHTEDLKELAAALAGTEPGPGTWQFGSMGPGGFDSSINGRSADFLAAKSSWDTYLGEHETDTIDKTEIFNIDLNTLISIDQRLEMMYHTTVPYNDDGQ